jgi:hypothetical protein
LLPGLPTYSRRFVHLYATHTCIPYTTRARIRTQHAPILWSGARVTVCSRAITPTPHPPTHTHTHTQPNQKPTINPEQAKQQTTPAGGSQTRPNGGVLHVQQSSQVPGHKRSAEHCDAHQPHHPHRPSADVDHLLQHVRRRLCQLLRRLREESCAGNSRTKGTRLGWEGSPTALKFAKQS